MANLILAEYKKQPDDNDNTTDTITSLDDPLKDNINLQKIDDNFKCSNNALEQNKYAYTLRNEFTSEIHKIELNNIHRYCGFNQLKSFMNKFGVKPRKCKIIRSTDKTFAFATFYTSEQKLDAINKLNGQTFKNKKIYVKVAKAKADPAVICNNNNNNNNFNDLKDAVIPLWNVDYQQQMKLKSDEINRIIDTLNSELKQYYSKDSNSNNTSNITIINNDNNDNNSNNSNNNNNNNNNKNNHNNDCNNNNNNNNNSNNINNDENDYCFYPLSAVIHPSPIINGYRNKNEFTCGTDRSNNTCVGFRLGTYKKGVTSVCLPTADCVHIPNFVISIINIINNYITNHTSLTVFDVSTHYGNWKQITVRSNLEEEIMLVIQLHAQNLSAEQLEPEYRQFTDYLILTSSESGLKLVSIYFQTCQTICIGGRSGELRHYYGARRISEKLLGINFAISPISFFQVNTLAAEILYSVIQDNILNLLKRTTIVLDLCCGTGSIGICLAAKVKSVIGIELSQESVTDAIYNASENNIHNCEFISGSVENALPTLSCIRDNHPDNEIIAILDPPRAGVSSSVIKLLRKSLSIKYLVYLSCSVMNAKKNMLDICRPHTGNLPGKPYKPIKTILVDLFPHTMHCELVTIYEHLAK